MSTFIQLSNEDIDTALSHDLREEVRRCNKHIAAMQARIVDERTQAYKDLLLEIDRSVYPEVYGYIEDKILVLKEADQ